VQDVLSIINQNARVTSGLTVFVKSKQRTKGEMFFYSKIYDEE